MCFEIDTFESSECLNIYKFKTGFHSLSQIVGTYDLNISFEYNIRFCACMDKQEKLCKQILTDFQI